MPCDASLLQKVPDPGKPTPTPKSVAFPKSPVRLAEIRSSVAIRPGYHDLIPLQRYGSVAEIASALGFLCSTAASDVNGQVLAVDGGFEAAGVGLPTLRKNGWGLA